MSAFLLDTHAWIWSLMQSTRLADSARRAIGEADAVHICPISVYEVARKARLGMWPEIVPHIGTLAEENQTLTTPFNRAVAIRAGMLDWPHRNPFDRIIAATAIEFGYALISRDAEFDALSGTPGWLGRIWN